MKNPEFIVLGLAAVAVVLILKTRKASAQPARPAPSTPKQMTVDDVLNRAYFKDIPSDFYV